MDTGTVCTFITKIESMPALPTVAFRVMNVTADPKSTANDLMKIINPDVSLTTKILKIANSPFYGLAREISSLQHAVTVLGFKEIRNLVISTVAFESFKSLKQSENFNINKFWKHSFCCGIAAKIIATELKCSGNELFVAGLIHDIGKLAMYVAFPAEFKKYTELITPLKIKYTVFDVEKDIFGMTHDEAGMKLLEKWLFPKNLISAVGFHHHPEKADNNSISPLIIHIADILTHIYEMSIDEEADEGGNINNVELFYGDVVNLARSHGIEWNVSDLIRLKITLAENMGKESEAMDLFL